MALHPRLSLKILSGGRLGWNGSGSRRAALGNLLHCGAKGMEVPGDTDVIVVTGMHSPEKPLQPCLAGQGVPQTFSVPSNPFWIPQNPFSPPQKPFSLLQPLLIPLNHLLVSPKNHFGPLQRLSVPLKTLSAPFSPFKDHLDPLKLF